MNISPPPLLAATAGAVVLLLVENNNSTPQPEHNTRALTVTHTEPGIFSVIERDTTAMQ